MIWIILSACIAQALGLHSKTLTKWPDSIVYFDIDPYLPKEIQNTIKYTVEYMNTHTCVRWEQRYPWSNTKDYVTFNYFSDTWAKSQCRADVGRIGGRQELRIGRNCWRQRYGRQGWQRRTMLHEMTHILGLKHEHQRPDRDCYVEISEGFVRRYAIVPDPDNWVDDFPYDYNSITHYANNMGITAWNKSITELGRQDGTLSPNDVRKIAALYCGEQSFCTVQSNLQRCRYIWTDKINRGCSNWPGWATSTI